MTGHGDRSRAASWLGERTANLKRRYSGSGAEALTQRLVALDLINRGLLFAASLLLLTFPFLIILDALGSRSAVTGFSRRLGLNHQAAVDVSNLFAPTSSTTGAVTGAGYVIFILSGIATATVLQNLYEAVFDLKPTGIKETPRRVAWLALLICASLLAGWAGPQLRGSAGPIALAIVGLVALTLFWWLTMLILLGGRVWWRELFSAAVATAVFWLGMEIVFAFTFSGMVTSNQKEYGAIGVVFALMTWLIAIGVVIILGAAVGAFWRERHRSLSTPSRGTVGETNSSTADQAPTGGAGAWGPNGRSPDRVGEPKGS